MLLVAVFAPIQCGGSPTENQPVAAAVTLSAPSHPLRSLGDTLVLTATVRDQTGAVIPGATVIWSSLAPQIATVRDGIVTAVKNGEALIIVVSGTVTDSARVTVRQVLKTLSKASPDTQAGIFIQPLPQAVTVVARDSGGHLAAGIQVSFTPTIGGGSVAAEPVVTDSMGRATDSWTLGNTLGTQELIVAVSVPAVADTFFATGTDGMDSLPQTIATVQAAVDLMTTGTISVYADCFSSLLIDCAGGVPGDSLALTVSRDSLKINPTSPDTFSFVAYVRVVSPLPIPFTNLVTFGSCSMGFNTAPGTSPSIVMTGNAVFARQLPTDPIDRIETPISSISGLEAVDLTINGGSPCAITNVSAAFQVGYVILNQAFGARASPKCGAPGPTLLEFCPLPPTVAVLRASRRESASAGSPRATRR